MGESCPLCQAILKSPPEPTDRDATRIPCPRCGTYDLDGTMAVVLPKRAKAEPRNAALVSHVLRRSQSGTKVPFLDVYLWESVLKNVPLPSPAEQAENLILWMGARQPVPGEPVLVDRDDRAIVGALTDDNLFWLIDHLTRRGVVKGPVDRGGATLTLTFDGWSEYERLRRESPRQTRRAIMAMLYNDPLLDKIFTDCFKPAVARTGFELIRLDDKPQAGLIDDRLRLEIRRSRFLFADLTRGSHGAYWEAGYAEGLGKPVIYTCERSEFTKHGTHFDTNHLHTVIWEESDLQSAADVLALSIRATLPDEAKLED